MNPTNLIIALAPAFAAGFAVQRLLEILDPLAEGLAGQEKKKIILGLSSLIAGLGIAGAVGMRMLLNLGAYASASPFSGIDLLDLFVTALVISAGTEGFNSILKFLSYKKEETKATAAAEKIGVSNRLARRGIIIESGLARGLTAADVDFTPGEAMLIAYKSVTTTTGSVEPIKPGATLAMYGARDPDIPTIRNKVINNPQYGLRFYGRTMDPNALKDLSTGWTLQQLADVTFDESV